MKKIVLVVIKNGLVETYYESKNVHVEVVDLDGLCIDESVEEITHSLPAGIGYEELAKEADIFDRVDFYKE